MDPSGNVSILPVLGPILPPFPVPSENTDTKDVTWDLIQQAGNAIWNQVQPAAGTIHSFHKGVTGSIAKAILDKPLVSRMPMAYILEKQYQIIFGSYEDPLLRDPVISESSWSPTKALKNRMARNETMIQGLAGNLENVNAHVSTTTDIYSHVTKEAEEHQRLCGGCDFETDEDEAEDSRGLMIMIAKREPQI